MVTNNKIASNEKIRLAIEKQWQFNFGFFRKKGFRMYDEKVGTWLLITFEKAEKIVCSSIMADPYLSGIDRLNQKSAWSRFLDWFSVAYSQEIPDDSKWFVGFTDCTVDVRDFSKKNHDKSLCCMQAIPVCFKSGPLSTKTMDFFLDLSGGDPIKINLFRSFLYMVFTNKTDLEIAPYFYGAPGMGKSTFLELIRKLSYGNSINMDLST